MRLQFKVVGHCIAEYIRCLYAFDIITFARHFHMLYSHDYILRFMALRKASIVLINFTHTV